MVAIGSAQVEGLRSHLRCGSPGCACARSANVHCPSHNDPSPSLTIHESAEGTVLFHCKGGCPQERVIDALKGVGLWPLAERRNGPERESPRSSSPRLVESYEYRDTGGVLVAVKGRFEQGGAGLRKPRKEFKWKRSSSPSWSGLEGLAVSGLPLWRADKIADLGRDEPIFFCEGEKAAQACIDQGLFATTFAGGASTKDFGTSLEVLRDRHVILWPDNDGESRRYMARVQAALRHIARSIRIVSPPVPEEGDDAFEFFKYGGSVKDLLENVDPVEIVVDYLSHDSLRVRVPTAAGLASFTFSSLEKSGRELNSEMEVEISGCGGDPFARRVNLLSGSQITDVRRELQSVFGEHFGWPGLINSAISRARKAYGSMNRGVKVGSIENPGPVRWMIRDLLLEGEANVWYGSGSSLKSYLAHRAEIAVALGYGWPGKDGSARGGTLYIDYESSKFTFRRRVGRLLKGLGIEEVGEDMPLFYWPGRGIALADQIEAVRAKVEQEGIVLVVIDSAAAACGGEAEKSSVALAYFNALAKLGEHVTTLTIAHTTKRGPDDAAPFGSIFWANEPRWVVNIARDDDEDSDEIAVGTYPRKANDSRRSQASIYRVVFEGDLGPVTIREDDFSRHQLLDEKRTLERRILDNLKGRMTIFELCEAMGLEKRKSASIGVTLGKMQRAGKVQKIGSDVGGRGNQARWMIAPAGGAEEVSEEQEEIPF